MDKHFLTPLFSPSTIAVLAGKLDDPESQTAQARALHQALRAQRFIGTIIFLDIHASGTLADLANTHADLAIIALPAAELARLETLLGWLGNPLSPVSQAIKALLSSAEVEAVSERISALLATGRFPQPTGRAPAVPWPPL